MAESVLDAPDPGAAPGVSTPTAAPAHERTGNPPGSPPAPPVADPPSIWRNRDYMGWWIGTTVSSLGTSLSALAFPLLMLYETGSVAKAGVIAACENVGRLVTLLIGGVLADRISRKLLMVAVPLSQAAAVGVVVPLVITHHVSVYTVGAVAAMQGITGGLGNGAVLPALKRIVPAEQFPMVSATRQARDQAAELVGPPLSGFLFGIARWVPFLGDAISYLAAALGAALIRTLLGPDKDEHAPREPMHRQLAEGLRFVRSNAYMRFVAPWAAIINGLLMALLLLFLALIRHRGGGPVAVGAVSSIGSIGALAGALASPWLMRKIPGRTLVVVGSWLLAAGVVAAAFVPRVWQIGAVLAVVFVFIPPLNTVFNSYEMKVVPDELYGRVSALITFLCSCLIWVGPIAAGLLADAFSPATAVAIGGAACAVLAVWVQGTKALHVLDEDRTKAT